MVYELALPPQWKIHPVFHASLLTPYVETPAHGPNYTRPPPDLVEGEAEWEVERILAHRYFGRQKKLQYLVKWLGYPESDNTWEPVENLHADDLIQDYEHRWQGAARQAVAAIHLRVAQTKEGANNASKYQEYTEGRLHQLLGQTSDCSTAKEIAQEALRRLKVKQIL